MGTPGNAPASSAEPARSAPHSDTMSPGIHSTFCAFDTLGSPASTSEYENVGHLRTGSERSAHAAVTCSLTYYYEHFSVFFGGLVDNGLSLQYTRNVQIVHSVHEANHGC